MNALVGSDAYGPTNPDRSRHPYLQDDEGNDDMPAHIRTALTTQTMSLGSENGQLVLGTWQAIDLWEYPTSPYCRRLVCHLHDAFCVLDLNLVADPATL